MSKKNKESLADKIADVLSAAPVSIDPEDDDIDNTRAHINAGASEESDNEDELLSSFRKQNIDLLGDLDNKYSGKRGSRKDLDDDGFSESENEYSEDENVQESEKDNSAKSENDEYLSDGDESEDDESIENQSEDEDEDDDVNDEILDENKDTVRKDDFQHMKPTDVSVQVKKGLSVRNQMNMWENLLEMRIQLQKCLITVNKMPQRETFKDIARQSGQDFLNNVATTKNTLFNVIDKLLLLQNLVLKKYPETKNLNKQDVKKSDDEEIPSDSEEEKFGEETEKEKDNDEQVPKKKRKLNDFEKEISERHDIYKNYRNNVIQKWNEKTRLAIMKNNASAHNIINHIEHTLSDKVKLRKRTQLKRSEYEILGKEAEIENKQLNTENQEVRPAEDYDTEIFDDDDFYHQLLRELIEVKSADLTDPVQLGRQWIQLQNLRSKMKKKIDTRATKGRKIRYAVHSKLVNFMAPIDQNVWTDAAKTELFSSLFGKNLRSGTT